MTLDEMDEAWTALNDREQLILTKRFALNGGKPMTFAAIGRELGVSRMRIYQLQHAALSKLRRARMKS